jgi:putative ABC transport system substrate-binding protein
MNYVFHRRTRALLFLLLSFCIFSARSAFAADKTIGVLMTGNIPYYNDIHTSFSAQMQSQGLGEDTVEVLVQKPMPDLMSWVNAARKFVAVDVDLIVAYGAPATLAILDETEDIPIVFAGVYDPEKVGISRKNTTGVSSKIPVAGLLKNFMKIKRFSQLGVTVNRDEKDTVIQAHEVKTFEKKLGFTSVDFNIKNESDITKIKGVDALFLSTSCAATHCLHNIVDIVHGQKVPTATIIGGSANTRVVLTIAANAGEQGIEAAKLAAQVLKGTNASSLPILKPKKIDMIINLKEATAMGLKVPFDLLTSATKVIK